MDGGSHDRRTYDLLRLIDENEPIGSIRLVDRLQRRGYSIKDRTVRLTLAELDEAGLTEKVSGKGRRLTAAGREELDRGDVGGRLSRIRERIATLTSGVTYDPVEDVGDLVAAEGVVAAANVDAAFERLRRLHGSAVGPCPVARVQDGVDGADDADDGDGHLRLAFPSSITLGGVLLTHGIDARLETAGLVEFDGSVRRYIDAISGENATMDVVSLLVEAGRTDVGGYLNRGTGVIVVDNRELPLSRYDEARDLSDRTCAHLGGVVDVRRPREPGPFPGSRPSWEFASLTYGGVAEAALSLLVEHDLLEGFDSLSALRPRGEFEPVDVVHGRVGE